MRDACQQHQVLRRGVEKFGNTLNSTYRPTYKTKKSNKHILKMYKTCKIKQYVHIKSRCYIFRIKIHKIP